MMKKLNKKASENQLNEMMEQMNRMKEDQK